MKGMLTDGSEPISNYAAGVTSTWLIAPTSTGETVENITISCNEIDLAAGDYIRIYDGENGSDPLLGEYTGKTPFEKITSTGGKILVKFTSAAASPTAKGFLLTYEAKAKKYCNPDEPITLTDAEGTFTDGSPEDGNYTNSSSCKWLIYPEGAVDPETEITFNFTRLDTEEGNDLIKFYDHANNIVTPKYTFSGTYEPSELPPVAIKTKGVMITFASNAYINGKGFEITYSTTPVSVKETENINDLSIYPNPATDKLNVKFNTSTADDFNITIYNVTGQAVYKESLNNFMGSYYNELNIADFAQGVYLMQIKSSKGATTKKIVVQ
jgi:hypothetical protein